MRTRVAPRHPPQEFTLRVVSESIVGMREGILPVINEEIRKGELVRVEKERGDTKGQNRYPEVYDPRGP